MKILPTKITRLTLLFLILILNANCAKDSDLLLDSVLTDPEVGIGDANAEEEEEENLVIKTASFSPTNDAYIQDVDGFDQSVIKLRENLRTSYLMFDLSEVEGEITEVSLEFTVDNDPGTGTIEIFKGLNNNWTEEQLSQENAPSPEARLGEINRVYAVRETIEVGLDVSNIRSGRNTLVLTHSQGNDLAIASKENTSNLGPKLHLTYMAPEGSPDIGDDEVEEEVVEEEILPDDPDEAIDIPCYLGSACATIDASCLDSNFPEMQEFALAGVTGGIPYDTNIAVTVSPGDNLQAVINSVNANGGGVILLSEGTYPISTTLNMKSDVVLRGINKETVIIESTVKGTDSNAYSIYFDGVARAGVENLTHFYRVDGCSPIDRENLNDGPYDQNAYSNDPCGNTNIVVTAIGMSKSTSNSWIDNCNILESGNHAVRLRGNNCTVSRSYIDRSYNKGPGGRGYFDITGDYNLVVENTIKRLRHFTIQLGARYNVVYKNTLWIDINFHNDDDGQNLIEQNTITTPSWHGWDIVDTGAPEFHRPPGPNNIIFNNTTNHRQTGENLYGGQDRVFTVLGFGRVEDSGKSIPSCNTFFPLRIN